MHFISGLFAPHFPTIPGIQTFFAIVFVVMDEEIVESVSSNQSAKDIFDSFIDGEASMDERDGRLEHIRDHRKFSELKRNISKKNYQAVQSILPATKSVDDNATQTLLRLCSTSDVQTLQVAVMIHYGANINIKGEQDITPLHHLAQSLSGLVCSYMVFCGANGDAVESAFHRTPLIIACMPVRRKDLSRQHKTVNALLSAHLTTLDHVDCDDNTALDYALQRQNTYLVRRLLAAGCSVMKTNVYRSNKLDFTPNNTSTKLECIDYRVSDRWLYFQQLLVTKDVLCERLTNFRLREELASLQRTKLSTVYIEHSLNNNQHPTSQKHTNQADIVDVSALEARKEHRRKHRETKKQQRVAKEQQAAEAEQEKKREQYMKRVEKEYHVSFKGLFT